MMNVARIFCAVLSIPFIAISFVLGQVCYWVQASFRGGYEDIRKDVENFEKAAKG